MKKRLCACVIFVRQKMNTQHLTWCQCNCNSFSLIRSSRSGSGVYLIPLILSLSYSLPLMNWWCIFIPLSLSSSLLVVNRITTPIIHTVQVCPLLYSSFNSLCPAVSCVICYQSYSSIHFPLFYGLHSSSFKYMIFADGQRKAVASIQ